MKFTIKTLKNFINKQPDNRKVDMSDNIADSNDCGCVLVHLGREKFKMKGKIYCGFNSIAGPDQKMKHQGDAGVDSFISKFVGKDPGRTTKTYKQLKTYLP